jgi:ABC-type Fe3+ transport system substrate-binding protein
MKLVISMREGRQIADVTTSIADVYGQFKKMKVLSDLRQLPNFKNLASNHVAPDGTWASFKLSVRCMSYNTNLVKKADLPKTWDDLLTNPRWRGGNLALSKRVSRGGKILPGVCLRSCSRSNARKACPRAPR